MDDLGTRVEAVKQLTEIFRLERFVYLAGTAIAVIIVIVVAIITIHEHQAGPGALTSFLGSGGLFAVTGNRVITMWTKSMDAVLRSQGSSS